MEDKKVIRIAYGALSNNLSVQLRKHGVKYDAATVKHLQLDIDAANRLRIRGIITDTENGKVIQRLHKKIMSHLEKFNDVKN